MSNQPTDNYDEYDLEDEELDDVVPDIPAPQKPPAIRKAQPPSKVVPLNRKAQAAQPQNAKPQAIAAQPQNAGAKPQMVVAQPQAQNAGANPPAIVAQPQNAIAPQAQNAGANPPAIAAQPQAQPQEDINELDELLAQLEQHRTNWLGSPPVELTENLGAWLKWGGSMLTKPVTWLFDEAGQVAEAESEYMSLAKKMMYRFGGAMVWAWSAFLTQAITSRVFPGTLIKPGDNFFQNGLALSIKAFLASLIFTFMISAIETMLFDKQKSRPKKVLILSTFVVDIIINAIGWADLLGHTGLFEWNPLAPLLRGKPIEWGSFFCFFAALLTASLPELMWEKARRARKPGHNPNANKQERGMWVQTNKGLKWLNESQIKQLQKMNKKTQQGQGGQR